VDRDLHERRQRVVARGGLRAERGRDREAVVADGRVDDGDELLVVDVEADRSGAGEEDLGQRDDGRLGGRGERRPAAAAVSVAPAVVAVIAAAAAVVAGDRVAAGLAVAGVAADQVEGLDRGDRGGVGALGRGRGGDVRGRRGGELARDGGVSLDRG